MDKSSNLTGKMLIAMPGMRDPRFEHSVILICAHSEDGAMGLVVNRPMPDIGFGDLLAQLGIEASEDALDIPVRFGGPVEPGRGFVLHRVPRDIQIDENRMRITDDLAMSTTRDILEDYARGRGPQPAMLALGYAGWGPGQLDSEILANGWLTSDRGDEIIFGADNAGKWRAALKALGIDPVALSPNAGHA
ncbi:MULTISPECIES: YqgE/AlgH family protein [unclassified Paracoccus (in: a-proteobacteria)]|uniref:YqgE/AlgH family protein n=1 Tax=unclassified Paracoccus (in: a-proteobacteria) TaxID=2688777 RepID=UPI0012B18B56|nr:MULTISPECIES: YqgE/AlgH family protein [unclassified Paracoccus (in: a-proteobacteria)]UXU75453.1 YqgE/AlgH family protein [Paracoccus sp. SMMA_5]UXU81358.1 YqgE/AlgH family protein [Paracoccus sp. SMMA_5_TC]